MTHINMPHNNMTHHTMIFTAPIRLLMPRLSQALAVAALALLATTANAQDVLIRNARVHTASAQGTLEATDVRVQAGRIQAIGKGLDAPAGIPVFDAKGRALTPALFAGITSIGLEEVSAETTTVDASLAFGATEPAMAIQMRPEFDVTLAYNPRSMLVPVVRTEGLGFTVLGANSAPGGSLLAGQGGVVRLDGGFEAPLAGHHLLFANLGSANASLSGNSRAAALMLLEQATREAGGTLPYNAPNTLLTPTGREVLARYLAGGRMVFNVDRAADIRQVLAFAKRHGIQPIIVGGAEAWVLAKELATAKVPVFVDPLVNLPGNFDQIGARMDNAARLYRAGVAVGFSQSGDSSHMAGKIRQLAGNAVANGLPWEAALAALTRVPAEAFGVSDQLGTLAVGKTADLTLWSGDPLEVNAVAEQVWLGGRAMPMRSRQTELRDRYLRAQGLESRAAGVLPLAYPAAR